MAALSLVARSRRLCAVRSPVRPSDAADLLALWLEQSRGGIEKLESLLWACHSSRRRILPPFSMEAMQHAIESNPLFEIDLASEADQFKAALKGAKINANTVNAMMRRMTIVWLI